MKTFAIFSKIISFDWISLDNSIWTIGHSNNDEKWMEKCYSYFLAYVDTLSRKKIRNFKHPVHEICPQTYGQVVF